MNYRGIQAVCAGRPGTGAPLWYPSYQEVAQTCHVSLGLNFVLIGVLFGLSPWAGLIFAVVWAGVKEYLVDRYIEKDGFWDNTKDAAFYMLGAFLIGLGLCHLAGK